MALPDRAGEDAAAQQNEGVRKAPGDFQPSNATHGDTRWTKDVRKWRKFAIYWLIFTDDQTVFARFALRHNAAGGHDGLVVAVAVASLPIFVG